MQELSAAEPGNIGLQRPTGGGWNELLVHHKVDAEKSVHGGGRGKQFYWLNTSMAVCDSM